MPYIYKITNKINGKVYVGQTKYDIIKRWDEHRHDHKRKNLKRPLYEAMRKYGFFNFEIEALEEVSDENKLNDRERYWIEYYGSFKNGYNATIGGEGKPYADYDLILSLWRKGHNNKEIQSFTSYDQHTITRALGLMGVCSKDRQLRGWEQLYRPVLKINSDTDSIIMAFPNATMATESVGKHDPSHITAVCRGKRKTAYGYKWAYIN